MMITSSMSTITFCGPVIRQMTKPFGISRERVANYMSGITGSTMYCLPYSATTLTCAAFAVGTGLVETTFIPIAFIPYTFYAILLFIVYWFAILTGWGRTHEGQETAGAADIEQQ